MNKIKTVLDRERLSSEFIQSKQDFDKVLSDAKVSHPGFWKTSWFFGVVGTASIVLTVTVISLDSITTAAPDSASETTSLAMMSVEEPVENHLSEAKTTEFRNSVNSTPSGISQVEDESIKASPKVKVDPESSVPAPTANREVDLYSQENNHKPRYNSMMPHFGTVYTGKISTGELCNGKGLECNEEWAITSFDIQFYKGSESISQSVRGNRIPDNICEMLNQSQHNLLFITNISAEHRSTGQGIKLNSMSLEATPL